MEINKQIKHLRLARGWSQVKLASMLNITQQSIQAIESGKAVPSFNTLENMAKVFGTKHEYFKECG